MGATVASFHDIVADPLTNYSATIDWGDGSSTSAGTIVQLLVPATGVFPQGEGYYSVAGAYTYSTTGDYTFHGHD